MELNMVSEPIEQSIAIALFIGLLYVMQICLRDTRHLEDRNQVRIEVAHRIRSGAFRRSVEYLRSMERVPDSQQMLPEILEPNGAEYRLPVETEWKLHPEVSRIHGQHRSDGSSRVAG